MVDKCTNKHRDSELLRWYFLKIGLLEQNSLHLQHLVVGRTVVQLSLCSVPDTVGTNTMVNFAKVIHKVLFAPINLRHDCHSSLPLGVMLANKLNRLTNH